MRTRTLLATGVVAMVLGTATPALAHTHQICTPGVGDPLIQPEPYHDSLPGASGATRQDLDTNPNYGSRGFHPIHESLHLTTATERNITVVVAPSPCP